MLKKSKKVFAGLLCLIMMMTLIPGNFVFGEETAPENDYLGVARKSQYVLYASSKENGIQLNGKNYVINGNVHSNSDVAAYLDKLDVRGKLEASGKVINYNNGVTQYIKKENAPERVLIDPSKYIVDSLGANPKVYENWTSLSDSTLENTEPIQAKSGLQFSASVIKLKNTIMSNGNMLVNASETFVSPENEEVLLYSANGDIQVSAQDVEINGIIYAPNGTVQIGGTNVKINGMIIAKKIQIGANNKLIINQNLNLKNAGAFKYYNEKLQIHSKAEYDDSTEAINVNWGSTFDEGKYEVYSSTDNKNFTLLGTVTGANTYAYKTNGSTNHIYFKVKQTLNNGFTKESNTVKMVYDVYKCQYVFEDTDIDSERLTDTYEFFLETDMNNVDTDGDELSDYAEVFLTGTDPLYKDSDEDGILDCDEDTDGDTLSNKYEMKLGTHPQKVDTDDDTLADNYEVAGIKIKGDDVNTYKTLPTNADTDGDTISDSDEALLGLNPLNPDTDGDGIRDGQELIKQEVSGYTADETSDSAVRKVSININATGNASNNTSVNSVMGKDTYLSNTYAMVGEPFVIETKSKFDKATITFTIDKNKLGSTDFSNLQILWFNEETRFFEIMPTKVDATKFTVSTETTHFSPFVVVDGYKWAERFKEDIYVDRYKYKKTNYIYNTIVALDCSENMLNDRQRSEEHQVPNAPTSEKYNDYSSTRLNVANGLLKTIPIQDKMNLMLFNSNIFYDSGYSNDFYYDTYTNDVLGASKICEEGQVDYNKVIVDMVNSLKRNAVNTTSSTVETKTISSIILVSDGEGSINNATLNYAKSNGIKIHTIWVGDNIGYSNMMRIASYTGGNCYKATDSINFSAGYSRVDTQKYLDVDKDTDGDGLADDFEAGGMLCTNGEILFSDYEKKHSDNDGLEDGYEVRMMTMSGYIPAYVKSSNGYIFDMRSDPMKNDTDGDGYKDNIDTSKLKYSMLITENGKQIVKHKFDIDSNANYICKDCGFKVKSPNLQDQEVLSYEDQLTINALHNTILYMYSNKYSTEICTPGTGDLFVKMLQARIDEIRASDKYQNKYQYCDNQGNCLPKIQNYQDYFKVKRSNSDDYVYFKTNKPSCEYVTDKNIRGYKTWNENEWVRQLGVIVGLAFPELAPIIALVDFGTYSNITNAPKEAAKEVFWEIIERTFKIDDRTMDIIKAPFTMKDINKDEKQSLKVEKGDIFISFGFSCICENPDHNHVRVNECHDNYPISHISYWIKDGKVVNVDYLNQG